MTLVYNDMYATTAIGEKEMTIIDLTKEQAMDIIKHRENDIDRIMVNANGIAVKLENIDMVIHNESFILFGSGANDITLHHRPNHNWSQGFGTTIDGQKMDFVGTPDFGVWFK